MKMHTVYAIYQYIITLYSVHTYLERYTGVRNVFKGNKWQKKSLCDLDIQIKRLLFYYT